MFTQLRLTTTKYVAITSTNLQHQLAYVWDAISQFFFVLIIMFIFAQLWTAVYEGGGSAEIGGLTLANTIWYFLIAEVMELSRARHDIRISNEVKDGSIAYTFLRPYNYLGWHFFNGIAEVVVKMVIVFLVGLPLVLYFAGTPTLELVHLPLVAIVMALAIVLDFLIFSIIGLLAFVTEDVSSFRMIYQKLVFILGGLLLPLDFLPEGIQPIARVLPFNLTTYAPARLFVAFNWPQFWQIIGLQLVWIAIIAVVLIVQYRWATRHLEINGG